MIGSSAWWRLARSMFQMSHSPVTTPPPALTKLPMALAPSSPMPGEHVFQFALFSSTTTSNPERSCVPSRLHICTPDVGVCPRSASASSTA
jgi:hypothetical protein